MKRGGEQNFLEGALMLTLATVAVKVIGALFKIPLANILGGVGMSYYVAAYDIFTPLYSMTVTGLGIAVSRLVAQVSARGSGAALGVFRTARRIFLLAGLLGAALLFCGAGAFAQFISNPGATLSIRVLAPAILFTCLSAAYRGYWQGRADMLPTASSQVLEAVFKLLFGTVLSYLTLRRFDAEYAALGTVAGQIFPTKEAADIAILQFSAAAAILGVTFSTVVCTVYLAALHRRRQCVSPPVEAARAPSGTARALLRIAVPISLATLVVNLTAVIDLASVMNCLKSAVAQSADVIRGMYAGQIPVGVTDDLLPEYLYGSYSGLAFSIFNLAPALTAAFGVSAVPAVTRAWTLLDRAKLEQTVSSILRLTLIVALPAGAGITALAGPILNLLYPARAMEAAIIAPVLQVMGISTVFVAVVTPMNSIFQATGNERLPLALLSVGAAVKLVTNFLLVSRPEINIHGVPYGTLLCYGFIAAASFFLLRWRLGVRLSLAAVAIKPLLCAAVCGFCARAVYGALALSGGFRTLLSVAAAAVCYLLLLLLTRCVTKSDLLMLPGTEKFANTLEKSGFIR